MFACTLLHGQNEKDETVSISVTIIDADSSEPIPYASIHNFNANRGTYSTINGKAELLNNHVGDSIYISSVGYSKQLIVLEPNVKLDIIRLTVLTHDLATLTIHADDTYLYEKIEAVRKARTQSSLSASSYFNLQTFDGTNQIELIECYYNGIYNDYAVQELQLKQGRIALKPFANRTFLSTEISKSICLHNAFESSDYFPHSPLEFSMKQNRKKYWLSDGGRVTTDDGVVVQIVKFKPKSADGHFFNGELWIDEKSSEIVRIDLNLLDAQSYPFVPIGYSDRLKNVNLHLTKNYGRHSGRMTLESVHFNYDLHYQTSDLQDFTLNTQALLVAFDYNELFTLPVFQFSPASYEDYVKINATPYNANFWSNYRRFEIEEIKKVNEAFIANDSTITNQQHFFNDSTLRHSLLERPYVIWNDTTSIRFRELVDDSVNYSKYQLRPPAERYHLEVQLYMDVNDYEGTLECTTATIFDPYKSYFYFPITAESNQFFNLYFDLAEQYRRKLERVNRAAQTASEMYLNYEKVHSTFEKTSKLFFKEVERGNNTSAMKRWRDKIDSGEL
ncbi:MAG: hypothetical protein R2809_11210 [Flavobacteriales bacterium]